MSFNICLGSLTLISTVATAMAEPPDVPPIRWDCTRGKGNQVVWRVETGLFTTAPVVHRGKVLVGTDNLVGDTPLKDGIGVLLCVNRTDGSPLWPAIPP